MSLNILCYFVGGNPGQILDERTEIAVISHYNYNLNDIVTPFKVSRYAELLRMSNFDRESSAELVNGFLHGFDIGYHGPLDRCDSAANIPITVGSHQEMWDKIMKEVKLGRSAGPFNTIPYKYFIQSPIGLVPKAGGQTRMIFHLSYDFGDEDRQRSLNYHTPQELCTVKYNDLDYAIKTCMTICPVMWDEIALGDDEFLNQHQIYFSKSDLRSAFKILPILPAQRNLLLYKARHPQSNQIFWFAEKTLPFGASVSCARFQLFSDSLKHIVEFVTGQYFQVTNYLDDFLFIARTEYRVNQTVREFLQICEEIGCPVALDKTEWGSLSIEFLGILLDGRYHRLSLPKEKIVKALNLLNWAQHSNKLTVKTIQKLAGTLNFLSRAIVPGRTFTRKMYDSLKFEDSQGRRLKAHHHININKAFKQDCEVWSFFLTEAPAEQICRPFVDLDSNRRHAVQLNFATDASLNPDLGMGGMFLQNWFVQTWDREFIILNKPSIAYLELYALVTAVVLWGNHPLLTNARVEILCDNESVKYMVNNMTSKCPHCMKLIRLLVVSNLRSNRRVFVRHLSTKLNFFADALSRLEFNRFARLAEKHGKRFTKTADNIPDCMWPMQRWW